MIDSTVIVRLQIKGLKTYQLNNWQNIYLPTSTSDYKNIAIIRPKRKNGGGVVREIKAYDCDYFQKNIFSNEIREASKNKTLTLEDILKLGSNARLRIMLLGYDEYSGSRKLFLSKVYTINDIKKGLYEKNSVNIKENLEDAKLNS